MRKLARLAFLIALTLASAAAVKAEVTCWFCVSDGGQMYCQRVVCPSTEGQ